MLVETTFGRPETFQKITPGNTVTAAGANVLTYWQHVVNYTSGGTTVVKVGDMIVGATTASASAIVIGRTITSGTDAGGTAAGVLTLKCYVGTFTSGENFKVEGGTDEGTFTLVPTLNPDNYTTKGQLASHLLVQVITGNALINAGNILPAQTTLTGIYLAAGTSYVTHDPVDIKNFACVDAASGQNAVIRIVGFWN
jgi:hypothetical protein